MMKSSNADEKRLRLRSSVDELRGTVSTPFGVTPEVYADYTASGKPSKIIEDFIAESVLPSYGNVHSSTTESARQTAWFIQEAKSDIRDYLQCTEDDAVILNGNGCTGALERFVLIMHAQNWRIQAGMIRESRWNTFMCNECGAQLENETVLRNHLQRCIAPKTSSDANRLVVILYDKSLHHSSFLPFRELKSYVALNDDGSSTRVQFCVRPVILNLHSGLMDTESLKSQLADATKMKAETIFVVANGSSNITGVVANVSRINEVAHEHGAYTVWDMASALSYVPVHMTPPGQEAMDVCVLSPHKLIGGVSTRGVLIIKKKLLSNDKPSNPGGGVVRFVSDDAALYIFSKEHREETGTADIVGTIRTGMAFNLAKQLPWDYVTKRGNDLGIEFMNRVYQDSRIEILGPLIFINNWETRRSVPVHYIPLRKPIFSIMIRYSEGSCSRKRTPEYSDDGCLVTYSNASGGEGLYLHHNFVCALLNDVFGIQARGGCSCAGPLAHTLMGFNEDNKCGARYEACLECSNMEVIRPGFTRISLHYLMTEQETCFIADAIKWIAEYGWLLLPFYKFNVESGEWYLYNYTNSSTRRWFAKALKLSEREYSNFDAEQVPGGVDLNMRVIRPSDIRKSLGNLPGLGGRNIHCLNNSVPEKKEKPVPPMNRLTNSLFARLLSRAADIANCVILNKHIDLGNSSILLPGIDALRHPLDARFSSLLWFPLPCDGYHSLLLGKIGMAPDRDFICWKNEHATAPAPRPNTAPFSVRVCSKDASEKSSEAWADTPLTESKGLIAHTIGEPELETSDIIHDMLPTDFDSLAASDDGDVKAISICKKSGSLIIPKCLRKSMGKAIAAFSMIEDGDRILIGVSGGKDSLTLVHCLVDLQRRAPTKFELAIANVDPQVSSYQPGPLKAYFESLNITFHSLQFPIMALAERKLQGSSICSFCARMKRGLLYNCMKEMGYNKLALAHHADDVAESFLMSAFYNGSLNTMKANYTTFYKDEDNELKKLNIIRPFVFTRERQLRCFAESAALPVIVDNCPACFSAPTERVRMKHLLASQEHMFPNTIPNILLAINKLIAIKDVHASSETDGCDGLCPLQP